MLVPATRAMSRGRSLVACLLIGSTSPSLQTSAFHPTRQSPRSAGPHARRGHAATLATVALLPGMADGDDGGGAGPFPELAVFDLDACFWDQEMYTLSKVPDDTCVVKGDLGGRGEGVIGVMSGRTRISLHKGSLLALQNHNDNKYPGMKVCFASSADTELAERIGRATLKLLEVVPGTTVWDLVVRRDWDGEDVNQIGRRPPLSANKSTTHFPILRELTRIRYDRQLFFDDCQWGDHCGQVERACKEAQTGRGVVTVRTPYGLGVEEWEEGLAKYADAYQSVDGRDNYSIKK